MVQPSRVSENWPTAPDDCKSGPSGPPPQLWETTVLAETPPKAKPPVA